MSNSFLAKTATIAQVFWTAQAFGKNFSTGIHNLGMALITLLDASLAFGHVALLDHADFALETSERIGLIGRNGTGKSSFLKILAGMEHADDGTLHIQQGIRIAYVAQEPSLNSEDSIFESVQRGLAPVLQLIEDYSNCVGDLDQ